MHPSHATRSLPSSLRGARVAALAGLVPLALASAARADEPLFTITGSNPHDQLASPFGIAPLGDVTGDGKPDFVIGEPGFDGTSGPDSGRVSVWSGATNPPTLIQTLQGANPGDRLGAEVHDVGDVDGDGRHDLAITSSGWPLGTNEGRVDVRSGVGLSWIWSADGEAAGDDFTHVRGVGDVTGDGVNDVVVGAPGFGKGASGIGTGKAYLFSGNNGALHRSWVGGTDEQLGFRVAAANNDQDGDGKLDFIVTSLHLPDRQGTIGFYSAVRAQRILGVVGVNSGIEAAYCSDGVDVDGDGKREFLLGAPDSSGGLGDVLVANVEGFVAVQGWLQGTAAAPVGREMAIVGDMDGDGIGDYLLASSSFAGPGGPDTGRVEIRSGKNLREITHWVGPQAGAKFGSDTAIGAGDLNGDGLTEILVGAPCYSVGSGTEEGRAFALPSDDLYLNANAEVYVANDAVTLTTTAGKPGNLVMVVLTELDGVALFDPITPFLTFDAQGELVISDTTDPAWGVHDATLQAWAVGRVGKKLVQSAPRSIALR